MKTPELILLQLKTLGPHSAKMLAERLEITPMGIRQHLQSLEQRELVCYEETRAKVGRPTRYWSLTQQGHAQFADGHDRLSAILLESGSPAASLQYRFGRPGHIELQHPQQGAGSLQAFRHASYGRYRVERQSVSFENQGVRYTIFDDYEGDMKPEVHERGVWVSQGERELATLRCTGPVRSELHRLREHLACDDTVALSCPAKP